MSSGGRGPTAESLRQLHSESSSEDEDEEGEGQDPPRLQEPDTNIGTL